jgi:FixJ family two-component response regulator
LLEICLSRFSAPLLPNTRIQLQQQLYRFSPETRVVIMTGRPDSEIRALALNGGASAFLAKPIDDETFLSSVRGALDE